MHHLGDVTECSHKREYRYREDLTASEGDGCWGNFKEGRAQRTDFRVLPYIIKPPFPSDGGCAAASAGRSGLRPSVDQRLEACPIHADLLLVAPRAPAGSR